MIKCVIIFAISFIFFLISAKFRKLEKDEKLEKQTYKKALATIDKVIYSETGNVKYYVSFSENGEKIVAQTDHYSAETKSLNPGDKVNIGYYFTKQKSPRAVIYDERLIPCSNSVHGFCKLLNIVGILLLIIALFMLIKINFI